MSNDRFANRNHSKTAARQTGNWVSADYPNCKFRSRLEELADRKNISFFIDKAEIVEKDRFKTKDGKQVPEHKAIKFTCSFVDSNAQEQVAFIEFPMTDRYRTCNTLLNKLLFAVRGPEYDGFISLGISATKDDKRRLWVDTFGDNEKRDTEDRDAFPFNKETRRFDGVPEMVPILNKKGEQVVKDGVKMYDTEEFDAFWLGCAIEICDFFDQPF